MMKQKRVAILAVAILLLTTLACNLTTIQSNNEGGSPTFPVLPGQPSPEEAVEIDPDLAAARLTEADLPEGFKALSQEEQRQFGVSADALANNFAGLLANARPQNFDVFLKVGPNGYEIVMATVLAPLNQIERIAVDLYFGDSDQMVQDFQATSDARDAAVLANAAGIGDNSAGLTFTRESAGLLTRNDLVVVRRDQTLQVVMVTYPDGTEPENGAAAVGQVLDAKVRDALD